MFYQKGLFDYLAMRLLCACKSSSSMYINTIWQFFQLKYLLTSLAVMNTAAETVIKHLFLITDVLTNSTKWLVAAAVSGIIYFKFNVTLLLYQSLNENLRTSSSTNTLPLISVFYFISWNRSSNFPLRKTIMLSTWWKKY